MAIVVDQLWSLGALAKAFCGTVCGTGNQPPPMRTVGDDIHGVGWGRGVVPDPQVTARVVAHGRVSRPHRAVIAAMRALVVPDLLIPLRLRQGPGGAGRCQPGSLPLEVVFQGVVVVHRLCVGV